MEVKKPNDYLDKRQQLDILEGQLKLERISFDPYWRDLSDYILPRRSRFYITDVNRGERKNERIVDSTASMAVRTTASGMMTGVTSPARSWFKLQTGDSELNDIPEVKSYLKVVTEKMKGVFLKSNLYNILPTLYADLSTFGTACVYMEEDMDSVVNFTSFPLGSFYIANNHKGRASVFMREFQMTVRQLVEKFVRLDPDKPNSMDWDKVTQAVKDQYEKGNFETQIDITHVIRPNPAYRPGSPASKYKRFESVYYEKGISSTNQSNVSSSAYPKQFLRVSGYDFFPVMAVRWETAGEDTYGTNCPGMLAIGDVKQLQLQEKRIAQAIEQKVRPSMIGPTSLKNQKASILPGDITYLDEREGTRGFRRLYEVDFDVRELEGKHDQIRQRISRAFYEDLFLMLANTNRRQITAREVEERHEEKLLALGPVLERINQDLLDPLIENTFEIMERQGMLPEVPEELAGTEYKIEYVSIMAQAQKLAGIGNIERLLDFTTMAANINPEAAQKIDVEEMIEQYADQVGVDSKLIKTKEFMEALRQQQAEAQAAEQEMLQAQEMANSAKTLSETKMDEDTALQQLLGGQGV